MKCPKCRSDNPETLEFCGGCGTKLGSSEFSHPPSSEDRASFTRTLETTPAGQGQRKLVAGRFELIEELGAGGMGVVYRAYDKKVGEEVALKFLHPEIARDERTVERFRNEIKLARKITHKNVCRIHELHEEGQTLFITMEYVPGQDLRALIKQTGPLSTGRAVSIAKQVAEGLAEAHDLDVIHRDLKPQNIMVDCEGNAKIMDFGIARSLRAIGMTAEGALVGTPDYMSPEQVEGKEADQRSDIYALGVILFEMVTGRVPFEGDSPLSVAYKHKNEIPVAPRSLNTEVPEPLNKLILRCLEKEKENRYQTADELLADLVRIEEGLPISERVLLKARPTIRIAREKPTSLRRFLVPSLALVVLAAAGMILWRFILPNKGALGVSAAGQQTLAVLPFTDLSPAKDQASWCEGIAETLQNSLANVRSLQVCGKYSSFLFKSQDDPREVGKKLNVGKLLTGSFQKAGNQFRFNVQLINTADGTAIWSDKFDGTEEEIFSIQDKIASAAISGMQIGLLEKEKMAVEKRYTNSKEAYNLYLQANHVARPWGEADLKKCIPVYLQATEKDPGFVLPYIRLARVYEQLSWSFNVMPRDEAYGKSKEALKKAFALDSENGEAYGVRADLKYSFENDLAGAELDYQRALQISPRSPLVLQQYYYWFLIAKGQLVEALSGTKLLVEIDPQDPQNYLFLGSELYFLHRYDDSIIAYNKALELDPNHEVTMCWSIFCFLARGQIDKALEMVKRIEPYDQSDYNYFFAVIEAVRGDKVEAEKHFKLLTPGVANGSSGWAAVFYAAMGNRDKALENLIRTYNDKNWSTLTQMFLVHFFDKYRADREFIDLLKKTGFAFRQLP
jgi:serine/threonine protein kinase